MVMFGGVKVSIIRYEDRKPYTEYTPPAGLLSDEIEGEDIYIEVATGDRFGFIVELTDEFDYKSSPDVQIICAASTDSMSQFLTTRSKTKRHSDVCEGHRIETSTTEKFISGRWWECGFIFSDLQLGKLALDPSASTKANFE